MECAENRASSVKSNPKDVLVSQNREPQCRPQTTIILIVGDPERVPGTSESPPFLPRVSVAPRFSQRLQGRWQTLDLKFRLQGLGLGTEGPGWVPGWGGSGGYWKIEIEILGSYPKTLNHIYGSNIGIMENSMEATMTWAGWWSRCGIQVTTF